MLEADFVQPVEEDLALLCVQGRHLVVVALREVEAHDGGLLQRRRRADGQEVVHLLGILDHVCRADQVAQAPAGDGVGLGKGGAADHMIGDLRQGTGVDVLVGREDDVLVHLVGDHEGVVLLAQASNEEQLFFGEDLAARVGRVADDDRLRVLAEGVLEHRAVEVERRRDERHEDRVRAGENGVSAVILIKRREDDDLVAGIADGHHRAHHCLGAAAGDKNLGLRIDLAAVGLALLAGERLTEVLRAERDGVLMRALVSHLAQAVGDRLGRREIREALGKIDGADLVADAGHTPDDGIGKRLNAVAQLWHKYSHLSDCSSGFAKVHNGHILTQIKKRNNIFRFFFSRKSEKRGMKEKTMQFYAVYSLDICISPL